MTKCRLRPKATLWLPCSRLDLRWRLARARQHGSQAWHDSLCLVFSMLIYIAHMTWLPLPCMHGAGMQEALKNWTSTTTLTWSANLITNDYSPPRSTSAGATAYDHVNRLSKCHPKRAAAHRSYQIKQDISSYCFASHSICISLSVSSSSSFPLRCRSARITVRRPERM